MLALSALSVLIGGLIISRPQVASAHPLGNFTINRYSRIEPDPGRITVRYVLDMAEIPTFQEMARIDLDRNGQVTDDEGADYLGNKVEELKNGLYLSVSDSLVALDVVDQELTFPEGQGGLSTLRLSILLQGRIDTMNGVEQQLYYRDDNYPHRLGWKEIVVKPGEGISLLNSTVPQLDQSDELRAYPNDVLSSPPNQPNAVATFVLIGPGLDLGAVQPAVAVTQSGPRSRDLFASLVTTTNLNLPVVVLAFLTALGLGALHAASPGHGKTIMAAYLVGTRGTPKHALFLGFTVTLSHTLGVLALGLVVLYASHIITPEELYPWLGSASGAIMMGVGVWLMVPGLRSRQPKPHNHLHGHIHEPPSGNNLKVTWRKLAALGVAGGLVPSASALVILLAAISLNRIGFGLLLILAFGAGMASVMAGIGLLLVYASTLTDRFKFQSRWSPAMPFIAGIIVLMAGLVVALRAAIQSGLL
jgi:ABC-type nickel/cobalt efflux system permease component RcnA